MPLMNIFEPLFILLFLTAVGALVTAAVLALRGQRDRAGRILRRLGIGTGVYAAIVVLTALGTQPRVYHVGEAQCFDDWCITVVDARPDRRADSVAWTVTLRLSSRARRITQRENDAGVYLTDARHRRYDPIRDDAAVPLDAQLRPGVRAARECERCWTRLYAQRRISHRRVHHHRERVVPWTSHHSIQ